MPFDARRAKALQAGARIIFDEAPGLRLVATASRKTWQYRYKSPIDGRMRQIAIGHWPAWTTHTSSPRKPPGAACGPIWTHAHHRSHRGNSGGKNE